MNSLRTIPAAIFTQLRSNALWLTLAGIVTIELLAHPYLFNNFFSHEVDKLLHTLETKKFDAPIITIGDSVGHGIFSGWGFARGNIANLACNQATETAGQYFFLKRYLEKNRMPRAVISCDRTPLDGNLRQNLTENYIQRCFTHWSEIIELALIKRDPEFTVKMIAYKMLSTYTYRLHLQKIILGTTNSNIYSGISIGKSASAPPKGIFALLNDTLEHSREESISAVFYKKISRMLASDNVPFYYIPPPSRLDNGDTDRLIQSSTTRLQKLMHNFPNIHVLSKEYRRLPNEYFGDDVHLNETGLAAYRPLLQIPIKELIAASLSSHRQEFQRRFSSGVALLSGKTKSLTHTLSVLHEATFSDEIESLKILATGKDPAVILPAIERFTPKDDGRAVAFFLLASEKPTIAKLYYSFSEKIAFSEKNSQAKRVQAGENHLYFVLPREFTGGMVRFDPGDVEGQYVLHLLEIRLVETGKSYPYINDLFQGDTL